MAILLKYKTFVDLRPVSLAKYYQDFTSMDLTKSVKIIKAYLERIEKYLPLLKSFRGIKSFFPIFSYLIINENLADEKIEKLFKEIKNLNGLGHGEDLSKVTITERYRLLLKLLERE